jgi:thiamine-phosphate pyrophosphorylase
MRTLDLISQAVAVGVPLIQIREKHLFTRPLFELTLKAVNISRNSETRILVNDRSDVAYAAAANGVHLTKKSLSVDDIKKTFTNLEIIGVSAHSLEDVQRASRSRADFAVFGPIFSSPGKGKPIGIGALKKVCEAVDPFPVVALGGVDSGNYDEALHSGASGFAAIRFLNDPTSFKLLAERGLLTQRNSPDLTI